MKSHTLHEDQTFENLVLPGTEISHAEFEDCHFVNCTLTDTIFTTTAFVDCTFTGCNLSMIKLKECRMNNVVFKGCKLLGVNFSDCVDFLFGISLKDCVADYASFVRKKMWKTPFQGTSLKGADFTEADLTGSKFANCNLAEAVFTRTICKETDFVSAINHIIDPELNNISKAKFSLYGLAGLLAKYNISIENE